VKRLIACVSLVAAASTAAGAATTPPPHASTRHVAAKSHADKKIVAHRSAPCRVAPADEYFGRLKMSILGIRNTIKDQGLRIDVDSSRANDTLKGMALTEDAIHDWQHKYPCDSWLPGTIFALEHFYGKIHTAYGVKRVHYTYAWLHRDFPHHALVRVALRESEEASAASPAAPVVDRTTTATTATAPDTTATPSPKRRS
jgi:hypothetical protein